MGNALSGRVALVTGASRGIGRAIAERFAEEGAHVAITARTLDPDPRYEGSLSQTAATIAKRGGKATPFAANLAKPEDRPRLIEEVTAAVGPVDVLVNNAAVTYLAPFGSITDKQWRLMVEIQVRAPYELAELVVPSMRGRGEGWILNISSRAGIHPPGPPFTDFWKRGFTVYGMVKAALERFSTGLAAELYSENIAVNALAPWDTVATSGTTTHDLIDQSTLEGTEWMAEAALALCTGSPKELTGRIAYSQSLLAELQRRPKGLGGN